MDLMIIQLSLNWTQLKLSMDRTMSELDETIHRTNCGLEDINSKIDSTQFHEPFMALKNHSL